MPSNQSASEGRVGLGPLAGLRVVEVAGIGPAPFCAMMLADMGADVIRVDRPGGPAAGNPMEPRLDLLNRGRRSIVVDLKSAAGVATLLRLAEHADVLIEGFRPGVAERLGFGPQTCVDRNPRLVYGRMTGWGQDGPLAPRAGHDINYIAISGALHDIGAAEAPPTIPLNLLGDFGGGGMLLAFGVLCGVIEAAASGRGQVIDASIVEGTAALSTMIHAFRAQGLWTDQRASNLLDGGAHFYGVYECADGGFVSLGAIEPQFYARLLALLGLADDADFVAGHRDRALWPALRKRLEALFAEHDRQHWCDLLGDEDVCFAPVLTMAEAPDHPHNQARRAFADVQGVVQPMPAPRFSRTAPPPPAAPAMPGAHTREVLRDTGFSDVEVDALLAEGAIG